MNIAIVEDDLNHQVQLREYIQQYCTECGRDIDVTVFRNGMEILKDYTPQYDIILLDIEMPELDGMQAAERIRALDADVVLMFITNIVQYAIRGYSVGALDYILKPVSYYTFSTKLARAISMVRKRSSGQIMLALPDGAVRLETRQIYYVDIQSRMLHYHTELGEFVLRGTLQNVENELGPYHFVRCNYWYLVNLLHVSEVRKDTVIVAGYELEISRRNKAAFMTALTNYVGGGA